MRFRILATASAMGLIATAASAHHSHPTFLLDQNVAVEGQIQSVAFKNPHVLIKLRTASTVYTAEWQGRSWFENRDSESRITDGRYDHRSFVSVTSDTLKVGDHIIVVGCPSRDPAVHELVVLKEVRRLKDGWVWRATGWLSADPVR